MKFLQTILVLAVAAMATANPVAEPDNHLDARAGCSPKGKYCNGGTFLCCGSMKCKNNVCH
ncbi:hypothetical protein ETB97_004255 [Aspergillus alliaceus]|uniref:Invertebrate defensins family profile domain-containing protein n=1 Tax=Petromyces alliaceus TaxID=209559 RepID=A0A5N6FG73_PETAA|nr:uncharacterized protein BDW43DRAFT_293599 [Aspergillus alliaceus]KAB8227604.1 hypothetical protein BDW43DRAFT_293599 [Aspergillus alliaceus]KAE8385202.1 hypothetical protein BDV23DRAFT_165400 [Aspergillus alliaceus]KAF5858571.1 hypothetical protein ETB97_004255 [Aspergillus burnettii]